MLLFSGKIGLFGEFFKDFLSFLKFSIELMGSIYDISISIPAKPLPQGMLNSGGFLLLWGIGR